MEKLIALTFDDGPNLTTTARMIEKLEKYGVTASFFLIGELINDETAPMVKKEFDNGYEIGNHSLTHSFMTKLDAETIREEIRITTEKIEKITGKKPVFFRPPYIDVNSTMVENIDLPFICGHGGRDWEPEVSSEERASLILDSVKDGSLVLLHDLEGNEKTVDALDILIPELKKRGFEFVTVSEIFRRKGIEAKAHNGVVYSDVDQTLRFDDPLPE